MKYLFASSAAFSTALSIASAQGCTDKAAQEINGNWYCQAVNAISYTNFGSPASYDKITSMKAGQCDSTLQSYSGGISPLDEEVSWHFRGPLSLKKFAFYTPGSDSSKQEESPTSHERRHGHQHFHMRGKEIFGIQESQVDEGKRAVGDIVIATINNVVVSWTNDYSGAASPQTTQPEIATPTEISAPAAAAPSMNAGSGDWGRQAYYEAANQTVEGLVFLTHFGGSNGSGVWDDTWGNSLSYAGPDGNSGNPWAVPLKDQMLDDTAEIVVMSDQVCDGDCGTVRPGTVAYHGFDGPSKVFLLELSMPLTGRRGWNMDMPAAWMLNAQIPRTMQYGPAECSCWTSGCGEWDILEILDSGNTRAKSTYHGTPSGGDSNYFNRPTDGTRKYAVIFDGPNNAGHIVELPADTSFDTTLPDNVVAGFVDSISDPTRRAVFALAS